MRWLMSLFFVLALAVMGCSETTGTGGSAGDGGNGGAAGVGGGGVGGDGGTGGGGVGGDGGTGGNGGVTDCSGEEDFTACGSGEAQGACFEEACVDFGCEGKEDLIMCWYFNPRVIALGACVDGTCIPGVLDCAAVPDGYVCLYGDPAARPVEFGVCEAGECVADAAAFEVQP